MKQKINIAVILAAGKGSRLSNGNKNETLKVLSKINGKYLILENIQKLRSILHVKKIYIVGGYKINELKKFFNNHDKSIKIINNKEWEKGNGFSFKVACKLLKEKLFYMQAGDHYFNDILYKKVYLSKLDYAVACSKKLSFFHDFNDATKVFSKKFKILDIGKKIIKFNGFDAGFFIINPKKLQLKKSYASISEILQNSKKKINRFNIENNDWIDLDTKTDIKNFKTALKNKIFTL